MRIASLTKGLAKNPSYATRNTEHISPCPLHFNSPHPLPPSNSTSPMDAPSQVRAGERAGVATPVNKALTETLLALTNKEIPLEEFSGKPGKLLAKMEK
ncbi:MAG: hypothetical protein AUJ21_08170 [Anaerolineae bacterium CG1_02_58_13]|nr:MAG: hypothetical protein AUJ21_08170 [Anaerolineae bacterium CG1_02_58_13]